MESNIGSVISGKSERQAVSINHCPTTAMPERPLVKHELMQHRIDSALTEVERCLESLAARLFCEPVPDNDKRSGIDPHSLPACFAEMGAMVQTRCEEIRDVINRIEDGLFDG